MNEILLLVGIAFAILLLLFLVLKLKIHAFISLLIVSIVVGIVTGMDFTGIIKSMQDGMGNTLGFVATVVGLGAIFGQMLEASGGAESIAKYLLKHFGEKRASWALVLTGFIVAIPVFLDVGFIILIPIIYELTKQAKRSILYYAIPLLAGLAVTHAFIPPTPGPVAVAEILDVQLGWIIIMGFIVGLPTAIIAGPIFGKYISQKIHIAAPDYFAEKEPGPVQEGLPSFRTIILIIALPLLLIVCNSVAEVLYDNGFLQNEVVYQSIGLLGHPFTALIISTLLAMYVLGIRRGFNKEQIMKLSNKALGPAGLIILVTGAGGVFKQILIDSGVGAMLAERLAESAMPPIVLAYLIAVVVRVIQGSATVSMITAAGIMAPLITIFDLTQIDKALIVLAIAAGSTILSHVNDSGFWLVGKYLGMNEKETLRSWTIMETIISVVGFTFVLLLSFVV
ncbi:GntP family permease [Sunxiuqinia dokdonensis]|uniref:Low-affinity gluconate/H+ symporter GntU n=1 Tax=Sunxiuqinia dokdonensis TaxID=1409788 RepID=A0A0L8VDG3_9BACT|nr:gluconate:H+ symporter [Sunxiuqinia dokdonensis]KOH46504.1 low-affinity gluconate/H+ symporter GntU [Sunxiuqinia dokdonensis]